MRRNRLTKGLIAATAAAAVAAATFAPAAGAASSQAPEGEQPTIAGIVASSGEGFDTNGGDYDVLLAAVTAADLVDTLNTPGLDVTVWAPKDRAFVKTAQDLGFEGAITDEAGAWAFLVEALTAIGGGDPIPTLTTILLYHVTPDTFGPGKVVAATGFPTLAEVDLRKAAGGLKLWDADPDLANPRLVSPLNVRASNGVIHTINRVLIPVNL